MQQGARKYDGHAHRCAIGLAAIFGKTRSPPFVTVVEVNGHSEMTVCIERYGIVPVRPELATSLRIVTANEPTLERVVLN